MRKSIRNSIKFLFNYPDYISTLEGLQQKYFQARDIQNTLIDKYISTDESIKSWGLFLYTLFPWFVTQCMPNNQNFAIENFAPDLSKEYIENDKIFKNVQFSHRTKHFLNTIECENEKDNMYVIWIIMWWMWFKFIISTDEKKFRVNQLHGALLKMLEENKTFQKTLPLFEDILNTILTYGDLSMIKQILLLMKHLKIKRNSTIDNIFFMAVRKSREIAKKKQDKKEAEGQKVQKISDMITEMEKQSLGKYANDKFIKTLDQSHKDTLNTKAKFTRRTFKPFKVRSLIIF